MLKISSILPLLELRRSQSESCNVPLVQVCKLCEGDTRKAIEVFRQAEMLAEHANAGGFEVGDEDFAVQARKELRSWIGTYRSHR